MRMTFLVMFLLSCFALAVPAAAQQAPLSEQQVRAFLASYPEMKELNDTHRDEMRQEGAPDDPSRPFANTLRLMEASSARDQFVAVAERYGFGSLAQWTDVAGRVVLAYGAETASAEINQLRSDVAQARRDLDADTTMSPREKAQTSRQLDNTQRLLDAYRSTPADKAAVRPYLQEIARVMSGG